MLEDLGEEGATRSSERQGGTLLQFQRKKKNCISAFYFLGLYFFSIIFEPLGCKQLVVIIHLHQVLYFGNAECEFLLL